MPHWRCLLLDSCRLDGCTRSLVELNLGDTRIQHMPDLRDLAVSRHTALLVPCPPCHTCSTPATDGGIPLAGHCRMSSQMTSLTGAHAPPSSFHVATRKGQAARVLRETYSLGTSAHEANT